MSLSRTTRSLLALFSATVLTWGATLIWSKHFNEGQIEFALKLAQQIASQVETGPTRLWTLHSLSVGAESRPIRVSPLRFVPNLPESEYYRLNPDSGHFTYYKILDRQKNEGVRVTIQLNFPGFLGFQTKASSDAAIFCTFVFLFLLVASTFSPTPLTRAHPSPETTAVQNGVTETAQGDQTDPSPLDSVHYKAITDLKEKISHWTKEAKKLLIEMTTNLKHLTKSVQSLLGSAIKTIEHVESAGQESSSIIEFALELEASLAAGSEDLPKARQHLGLIKKAAELTNQNAAAALEAFGPLSEQSKTLSTILANLSGSIRTESDRIRDLRKHALDPSLSLLPPMTEVIPAPTEPEPSPPETTSPVVEPPGPEEPAAEVVAPPEALVQPPTDEELSALTETSLAPSSASVSGVEEQPPAEENQAA